MKRLILGISLGVGLSLSSCDSTPSQTTESALNAIHQLEQELFAQKNLVDKEKALTLINKYIDYAKDYSKELDAPEKLMKAADIAMHMNEDQLALEQINKIQKLYPTFKDMDVCLFLKAHLYEDKLGMLGEAKEIYNKIIKDFPNSQFADDAEGALKNLGLSPEEMLKKFQEMNKQQ